MVIISGYPNYPVLSLKFSLQLSINLYAHLSHFLLAGQKHRKGGSLIAHEIGLLALVPVPGSTVDVDEQGKEQIESA